MDLHKAIELIRFEPSPKIAQAWADLGCGRGLFTKALATLLPAGSRVHAIDLDEKSMREIPTGYNNVEIIKTVGDFSSSLLLREMDGFLMANSLHYVADKENFLNSRFECLTLGGYFLLVEYDLKKPNQWVPFPITINEATMLLSQMGFRSTRFLNQRPSVYGNQRIYAMLAIK